MFVSVCKLPVSKQGRTLCWQPLVVFRVIWSVAQLILRNTFSLPVSLASVFAFPWLINTFWYPNIIHSEIFNYQSFHCERESSSLFRGLILPTEWNLASEMLCLHSYVVQHLGMDTESKMSCCVRICKSDVFESSVCGRRLSKKELVLFL